ncbi:hypothetical protein AGMMS49545_08800 [Betaproteobacteria bacterium]|nr:hypothetical protein AGMMS49545_08800 [Betaproteobacteria bacterium]GHU41288.1 hypothetical protein AGMMS50289_04190 [Betaproteobacteria bacterium]
MKYTKTATQIFTMLVLCCGLWSCGQNKRDAQTSGNAQTSDVYQYNGWKDFSQENYSIKYPSDWKLNTSGMMESKFFIFSQDQSPSDNFAKNVVLLTEQTPLSLDDYIKAQNKAIEKFFPYYKKIEGERIQDGSGAYYKLIGTFKQGDVQIKNEQHIWLSNGTAYILTFTSAQNDFDRYKDIGKQILASFRIK